LLTKEQIIGEALRLGFDDVGFTSAEPFDSHKEILLSRLELYDWCIDKGINLIQGTDPQAVWPQCRSIIVLIENYHRQSFPASMLGKFGRCYMDDDRVTKDGVSKRIKAFRSFLRENSIDSRVPFNVPQRLAAARAGLGTFGKNCLFYSRRAARQSSWVSPITVLVDVEFTPDTPTMEVGCPNWCRNACIASCPTGALLGPRKIDPRRCISYLSYYGEDITPLPLREPMGMKVYGCDRCQEVCPRNESWMVQVQELEVNPRAGAIAPHFELRALLHMDVEYYKTHIWPHMFYMEPKDLWRFQMNVARAMGNSRDPVYLPDLIKAFQENNDERVVGMAAWAIGRIGGDEAQRFLKGELNRASGLVREEIEQALQVTV
jgi:epoxyqueuosine reductase